jgi:hypothetical protein
MKTENHFNAQLFRQAINDNKHYAEETKENIADYFLRDFEASPEGWDFAFEFPYDQVSAEAKEQRKSILTNMLVMEGYIPTE